MRMEPLPNCKKKTPPSIKTAFACHELSVVPIALALGLSLVADKDVKPRGQLEQNQIQVAGIDHAGEMDTCKKEIAKQALSIIDWQWGDLRTFGDRRVRVGKIRFVDLNGQIKVDRFTCSFDVPPTGNDFFIGY